MGKKRFYVFVAYSDPTANEVGTNERAEQDTVGRSERGGFFIEVCAEGVRLIGRSMVHLPPLQFFARIALFPLPPLRECVPTLKDLLNMSSVA